MDEILGMYKSGMSSIEIGEKLNRNPRQIQRIIAKSGITRDSKARYINAIARGRRVYTKLSPEALKYRKGLPSKLRYTVLSEGGFKCCLCGNTAQTSRIEIDHIDNNPANNSRDNLQVLCNYCNKGKAWA